MATDFITPVGYLRYVRNLWTASRYQNKAENPNKYRVSICIPLTDPQLPQLIADYNAVVTAELEATPPVQPGGLAVLPRGKYSCLEFGAVLHPGDAWFADKLVLAAARGADDGAPNVLLDQRTPVVDRGEIYDGVMARGHCKFWTFTGGKGGINCDVFAVLKVQDSDPVGAAAPDSAAAFAAAGITGSGPTSAPLAAAPAGFAIPGTPPAQVAPGVPPAAGYAVPGVPPAAGYAVPGMAPGVPAAVAPLAVGVPPTGVVPGPVPGPVPGIPGVAPVGAVPPAAAAVYASPVAAPAGIDPLTGQPYVIPF